MLEKQVEVVSDFAKTRIEEAQETLRKLEGQAQDFFKKLLDESTGRLEPGRERIESLLDRVRESREQFENLVSDRVTRAVNTIGLPTSTQLEDLSKRVDQISKRLNAFAGKAASKVNGAKRKGHAGAEKAPHAAKAN